MVAGARRKEEPMRSTAVQCRGHRLNIHSKPAEATERGLSEENQLESGAIRSAADRLRRDIQTNSFFGAAREDVAVADGWR